MRYGLYARKSKDDNSGTIKSIQDQLDVWRELARERGLEIVREYEENKTAKVPGVRPVYNGMLADLKAGAIDGILVWHVNRLARNMAEAGALAQLLIDGKIREIRTPHWTYRPGDNILPLLLEQGMSTQYSLDLSEAVKRGITSMVEAGGWPHQAKVGYLNRRDPDNPKRGIVVKDPERFDLVRKGMDLLLTGAYTVRQVTDTMNREWGFTTRSTPSRPHSPLSYAAAYDVFSSPFYAGFTRHNGELRRGRHEPMITVAEHNRLLEIVRSRSRHRQRRNAFTYTGLIRCGFCGLQVTAEQHDKSGKRRIYYHCSDAYHTCTKRGINEEALEAEITRWLEGITLDPEVCRIALDNIERWLSGQGETREAILAQQQAALQSVQHRRRKLLSQLVAEVITDEALYKEEEAALQAEQKQLELAIAGSLVAMEHMRTQARAGYRFIQRAKENFLLSNGGRKKEIARALGQEYTLRGNELSVTLEPLLMELVRHAKQVLARLEPPKGPQKGGNHTGNGPDQAFFDSNSCDGRDTRLVLEPSHSLLVLLEQPIHMVIDLV